MPDITLQTTTEKVQFLFNQNFHKYVCKLKGAHAEKTMQMPFTTALCDVTVFPAVGKCQKENLNNVLFGTFNLLSTPQSFNACSNMKFIDMFLLIYFF